MEWYIHIIQVYILCLNIEVYHNKVLKITWLEYFLSLAIRNNVASNKHIPCPQSPNMTAKRNGNVMIVYTVGFASWYLATLHLHGITDFSIIHKYRTKGFSLAIWKIKGTKVKYKHNSYVKFSIHS